MEGIPLVPLSTHLSYHASSSQRHLLGDHNNTTTITTTSSSSSSSSISTPGQNKTFPVTSTPCYTKWPRAATPDTRFCCMVLAPVHQLVTSLGSHHISSHSRHDADPTFTTFGFHTGLPSLSSSAKFSHPASISASQLPVISPSTLASYSATPLTSNLPLPCQICC